MEVAIKVINACTVQVPAEFKTDPVEHETKPKSYVV